MSTRRARPQKTKERRQKDALLEVSRQEAGRQAVRLDADRSTQSRRRSWQNIPTSALFHCHAGQSSPQSGPKKERPWACPTSLRGPRQQKVDWHRRNHTEGLSRSLGSPHAPHVRVRHWSRQSPYPGKQRRAPPAPACPGPRQAGSQISGAYQTRISRPCGGSGRPRRMRTRAQLRTVSGQTK
eukprot:9504175-Pyramimonas_sp.AAC.2